MPCYTVRVTTVNLDNANRDILADALIPLLLRQYGRMSHADALSYVNANYNGKKITLPSFLKAEQVKVAYSEEVIKAGAKRFGWSASKTGEHQFVVAKQY